MILKTTKKEKNICRLLIFFCFAFSLSIIYHTNVFAAVNDITVKNNDNLSYSINIGDTGKLSPDMTTVNSTNTNQDYDSYYNYFYDSYYDETSATDPQYTNYFESNDPDVLSIDDEGNYHAVNAGTTTVYIYVYSKGTYYNTKVFSATVTFTVKVDMTNVTLSTDNVCAYLFPAYYTAKNKPQYDGCTTQIAINSSFTIDTYYADDEVFSYSCSNSKLSIDAYIENNIIYLNQNSNNQGKGIITLTIYDKSFTINYEARKVGISDQSYLLVKKKKYKMSVTGYDGDIKWKSSNTKVATVDSKGVITGKKIGNCIITAQIGERYLGCAVSVTTAKLKKVTERATYIGTHWKYSQPKRSQKGYYDCSALVWKAYKEKAHVTFGSSSYPGTTSTESAWCKKHGRMIKGGMTYKKFLKMTVNPGDIMFKSTNKKKKYSTTYHVEMFTGYICNYVDSNGKASFSPLWAARGSYYSWEDGSLLARPMK